jgi:hypothetical protein
MTRNLHIPNFVPNISSKRHEFIIYSLILSTLFLIVLVLPVSFRILGLIIVSVISVILTLGAVRFSGKKFVLFILSILPFFFTLFLGLFYFILPVRWITRIPMFLVYAFGMYSVFLAQNIFFIAVSHNLALIRVARAIGFLLTLMVFFTGLLVLFSFHFYPWSNMVISLVPLLLLFMYSFWTVTLDTKISERLLAYSGGITLLFTEGILLLSLFPLKPILASLFVTTGAFTIIGIVHLELSGRFFKNAVYDYIRIFVLIVFLIVITFSYR